MAKTNTFENNFLFLTLPSSRFPSSPYLSLHWWFGKTLKMIRRHAHPSLTSTSFSRLVQQHPRVFFSSSSSSLSAQSPRSLPPPSLANPNSNSYHNARIRKATVTREEIQSIPSLSAEISKLNQSRAQLSTQQNQIGSRIRDLLKSSIKDQSSLSASNQEAESESKSTLKSLQVESSKLRSESRSIANQIQSISDQIEGIKNKIPNETHPESPIGKEENARVIKVWSPSNPSSSLFKSLPSSPSLPINLKDFPPSPLPSSERDYDLLASSIASNSNSNLSSDLNLSPISFRQANLTSGPGMLYLLPPISTLSNSLIQISLKLALSKGFQLVSVPDLIKADIVKRCGFEPRGESSQTFFVETERDRRKKNKVLISEEADSRQDLDSDETSQTLANTEDGNDLCLIGTAEIPLVSLLAGQTFPSSDFDPIKLVAHSHAYRAEAGARGKESKGLYRVHQFDKVEMVVACQGSSDPQNQINQDSSSSSILEELREIQEEIAELLGLTYR